MYKVSVIVPVYNVSEFLNECILSVIYQSYKNWELILVDDGSTDDSLLICERYARKDNRIRVLHSNHGGVGFARNKGLDVAKGEFITFLDSDDWIEKDFLKIGLQICEKHNLDIFMAGFVMVKGNTIVCNLGIPEDFSCRCSGMTSVQLKQLVEYNYCASCCAKLYKRELVDGSRFDINLNIGEDLKFVFELLQKNPLVYASNYIAYKYRRGHTSLTCCVNENKCRSVIETARILFHQVLEKSFQESEFSKYVEERYQRDCVYMLGVVINEPTMNMKEKIKCIFILLKNPKKNGFTFYPIIGLIKRHFQN